MGTGMTRKEALKITGLALGGVALGSVLPGCGSKAPETTDNTDPTNTNSLIDNLPAYYPGKETLGKDAMRITFLGTSCIPRINQECNSIYVETGSGDAFVFDCGSGTVAKYDAMGIPFSQMSKIFLTHLHGDHMDDLTHIYTFGPSTDRKSPLYVWGPTKSGVPDPVTGQIYEDGTHAFCERLREACRWHSESFSFGATSYKSYVPPTQASWGLPVDPVPVSNDSPIDGYALVPIELDWTKSGSTPGDNVAYNNPTTGVKITHFPAIHDRKGSISYKLEWNGLSMIFTGDTKPNNYVVQQAGGVNVLIHEMVVPAEVWAMKNLHITNKDQVSSQMWNAAYNYALAVQNSSHTPQGAFGYILSQIKPAPKLAVATHFQATDDTIDSAMKSIRDHYPTGDVTIAADFMVLNVSKSGITRKRAVVSDWAWFPLGKMYADLNVPKYHNPDGSMDPTAQIDQSQEIPPTDPTTGKVNYNQDGY
jgi:ribonuclease Z